MKTNIACPRVGTRFGALTITGEPFYPNGRSTNGPFVPCTCDCGRSDTARVRALSTGEKHACAHCNHSSLHRRHGDSRSVEYITWSCILRRAGVTSKGTPALLNSVTKLMKQAYMDRGITVCRRWLVYENFLADMGRRPAGMSIDRRNNDKGYSPGNCRWATPEEQSNNKRNNVFIEYKGERLTLAQWSRKLGIANITITTRYRSGDQPPELFRPTYPRTQNRRKARV